MDHLSRPCQMRRLPQLSRCGKAAELKNQHSPQSYHAANGLGQLGGIVSHTVFEHGFDFFDVGDGGGGITHNDD